MTYELYSQNARSPGLSVSIADIGLCGLEDGAIFKCDIRAGSWPRHAINSLLNINDQISNKTMQFHGFSSSITFMTFNLNC